MLGELVFWNECYAFFDVVDREEFTNFKTISSYKPYHQKNCFSLKEKWEFATETNKKNDEKLTIY